jgi:two-component system, cell cycle response regulator
MVLVDADNAAAFADTRAAVQRRIHVGARGRESQLAQVPRPINMMALLKLLDGQIGHLGHAGLAPQVKSAPAAAAAVAVPSFASPAARAPARPSVPINTSRAEAPVSELLVSRMDHILVVDDSDIALRFMANCLGRFGFDVHLARSGEEALQRVSEEHYAFVFLDVTMPGIDGYQTCKLIKKRPYPRGQRAPTVVMLTSRGGMVDKMRGTLAGCDAYLTKPLQHDALMKIVGDSMVSNVGNVDTQRSPLAMG